MNMIATNNTMILVDSNSGIKISDMRNEPGLMIEKQPGSKVERLAPPPIPNSFFNQIEMNKMAAQEISGVHDVSKGLVQGQVSAGSAIQILTENSQTRLRGKLRNVENSVKRMGKWYLAMFRQFYTEPRIIRLTGDSDSFKFADFDGQDLRTHVPKVDENTGQPIPQLDEQGQPVINPQTGQPEFEMEELLTDFDIQVSSGSSMMMNKSAKYQQVFELFQAGAVDVETLLQHADIGDSKEILQRMISHGTIPDPNQPKVDIAQLLGQLGVKVNLNTNDPALILEALNNAQQQLNEVEQMTGQLEGDMNQRMDMAKDLTEMAEGQMPEQMPMEQGQMGVPSEEEIAMMMAQQGQQNPSL